MREISCLQSTGDYLGHTHVSLTLIVPVQANWCLMLLQTLATLPAGFLLVRVAVNKPGIHPKPMMNGS